MKKLLPVTFVVILALLVTGCSAPTAMPTATPAPIPTNTPLPTATLAPTATTVPTGLPTRAPTAGAASGTVTGKPQGNGLTLYEFPVDGFSLSLPEKWVLVTVDPVFLENLATTIKDATLAQQLASQMNNLKSAGGLMIAFDFNAEDLKLGFSTNLNIIKQTMPLEVPVDYFVGVNKAQIEGLTNVVKPVASRTLKLTSGQDAVEFKYQMTMVGQNNQQLTAAITQVAALKGRDVVILTFTTLSTQASARAPVFDQVVKSFTMK